MSATTLTLVDAATTHDIGSFSDGAVLDLGKTGTHLSVRANPGAAVGSVRFNLDGSPFQTENFAPYAIKGDTSGRYNAWTPAVGDHTLVVTTYSGRERRRGGRVVGHGAFHRHRRGRDPVAEPHADSDPLAHAFAHAFAEPEPDADTDSDGRAVGLVDHGERPGLPLGASRRG